MLFTLEESGMKMTKEQGSSLFYLALGLYGLIFSVQLPFGRLNNPGPAMFPFGLSILLLISGILWFIRGKGTPEEREEINWAVMKKGGMPFKIILSTAAFIPAIEPLGFLLSSFVFILVLFVWVSGFRVRNALGLALIIAVGSWLFFGKLFSVQFPQGLLPF
jgi:putative tricarboxylic transport membrane protein